MNEIPDTSKNSCAYLQQPDATTGLVVVLPQILYLSSYCPNQLLRMLGSINDEWKTEPFGLSDTVSLTKRHHIHWVNGADIYKVNYTDVFFNRAKVCNASIEKHRQVCMTLSVSSTLAPWVMIRGISTPAPLAFFWAERSQLAGRAQINTLVLSGSTLQCSHNIEPPTHTPHLPAQQPDPWHSSAVLWKHGRRQHPGVSRGGALNL